MLTTPMDLLTAFPLRKTKEQKKAFLGAVQSYATALGYESCMERDWLRMGVPESASYLLTAENTGSGILVLLEILRALPENRRNRVCFLLFQDSQYRMCSYRKLHPEAAEQLVLRLENVGTGDKLRMFPTRQLNANRRRLTSLYKVCGYFGKKSLLVQEKDLLPWYAPFPYIVSICAVPGGKKETYRSRLRSRETTIEETNINILRAALVSFLCCDAAQ